MPKARPSVQQPTHTHSKIFFLAPATALRECKESYGARAAISLGRASAPADAELCALERELPARPAPSSIADLRKLWGGEFSEEGRAELLQLRKTTKMLEMAAARDMTTARGIGASAAMETLRIDERAAPLHLELVAARKSLPAELSAPDVLVPLELGYLTACTNALHEYVLCSERSDLTSKEYYAKRFAGIYDEREAIFSWLRGGATPFATPGPDVRFFPRSKYGVFGRSLSEESVGLEFSHAFSNAPVRREVLSRGTTHVAIGFVASALSTSQSSSLPTCAMRRPVAPARCDGLATRHQPLPSQRRSSSHRCSAMATSTSKPSSRCGTARRGARARVTLFEDLPRASSPRALGAARPSTHVRSPCSAAGAMRPTCRSRPPRGRRAPNASPARATLGLRPTASLSAPTC